MPTMTSNTEPSPYVASASSEDTFPAYYAFDDTRDNYWAVDKDSLPEWVQIDLGSPKVANSYEIVEARELNRNPRDFTLEGSNDESSWDVLDTRSDIGWSTEGETQSFSISSPGAYRYYRLTVVEHDGHSSWAVVGELRLLP